MGNKLHQPTCMGVCMRWVSVLLCLVSVLLCKSQTSTDSTYLANPLKHKQLKYRFTADFFTSFSLTHIINKVGGSEDSHVYLYYNVTLTNNLSLNKFSFDTYYFNDFGIKKYFDSISIPSDDQYNFRNTLSYRIGDSRLAVNIGMDSKSQYHRHYTYVLDSVGQLQAQLYTSYLSPGYRSFSGGISYNHKRFSLNLGLVNGMRTFIRNQELYTFRRAEILYGVSKGEKGILEYGFNLILTVPMQKITKNVFIEHVSQFRVVNSDLTQLSKYAFDINQAVHYTFLKYFRFSLRTKCIYDYRISRKLNVVNNLSLGFYLNNAF